MVKLEVDSYGGKSGVKSVWRNEHYRMKTCLFRCLTLASVLILTTNYVKACCVNITVAVLLERSAVLDFPFQINRTIGLIEIAINKSRDILQQSVHLEFIIRYADVTTCTALEWGALAADIYHNNEIHAIIGPGNMSC